LAKDVQEGAMMIGQPLRHFQVCASTNDEAWRWASEGAPHGALVQADAQTAGRGRQGRSWNSPSGRGLYLSYILRLELEMAQVAQLTVIAALSGARAVEELCDRRANTKWPNDIILNDRKIGGILCEAHADPEQPGRADFVVVGLGLNINLEIDDLPPNPKIPASSLLIETRRRWDIDDAASAISKHMGLLLDKLQNGEWNALRSEFELRDILRGRRVSVETPNETFQAIAEGIDADGILCVITGDEVRRIVAGDVKPLDM